MTFLRNICPPIKSLTRTSPHIQTIYTMSTDTKATPYKAKLIAEFIASHHARLRQAGETRPLMVSMQGPQGCGKSTLAAALMGLVEGQYGLKIAVASLDGEFRM